MKNLLGIYEKAISNHLSWDEKFALAEASGFECIELSVDATKERLGRLYDPSFVGTVKEALRRTPVRMLTMALTANRGFPLGSEDPEIRKKAGEIIRRAVPLAEELGIAVVHIAGYDELGNKCNDETKKLFRDSVEEIVRFAEDYAPKLAIETMDAEFMGSCTNIRRLCEEIGSEKFGIYADVGNLAGMGKNVAAELEAGGDLIAGIHLKDSKPGIMWDVVFGEGIVDFEEALGTIARIGYRGPMIAETWSYDDEAFHPYLKEIASFLRSKMNDVP